MNAPDYGSVYRRSHEPTPAQLKAGNYPKKRITFQGIPVSVENPAGSVRRGVDPDGRPWETRMIYDYGYVRGSLGLDGDHVDVFIGPYPDAEFAYLIEQRVPPKFDRMDEQKAMLGFDSLGEACAAYLQHYNDSRFLGPVRAMPMAEFRLKVLATAERPAMIKAACLSLSAGCETQSGLSAMDFGQAMLAKSEHGPIPAGAHWITATPPGHDKGHPILVMPQSDGSLRVIGGAGGSLNHLKLRGVKQGEGYKDSIKQRQQERQQARKEQIAKDKELGIHGAKVAERGKLKGEMQQQRRDFVKTVSDLMGWQDTEFDESKHAGLSPEAVEKARKDHEKDLFRRAKQAVDMNRKNLAEDHDARAAAGLGELPMQAKDGDVISVADLSPMRETSKPSLGFAPNYGQRAAEAGLTPDAVEAAAATMSPQPEKSATAPETGQKLSEKIAAELDQFKLTNPESPLPSAKVLDDAKKAVALIKAQKKLRMAEQMARQASAELAAATVVESKAHILEVSDADIEEAARKQMEDDVRTVGAVGLLSEIDKMGGEESLGGHVAAGAFNSMNAFATAVGGEPLIDRSVVDVLGVNAAAQVLARRIAKDYEAGDFDRIRQGVEDFHINSQQARQEQAVSEARELAKAAGEIELPEGATGFDLAHAQDLNHKRREAVNQAKRILGQATGELQANAALVMALKQGAAQSVEVPMGKADAKSAITQLGALGLKPSDYSLEEVGGNLVATISADGMDKLAKPVDVDGMKQIRRNLDIISGKHDEEGWLPQGFANRPDLAMHVEPGVAPKLAEPFKPGEDLNQSLRDYIGGRMADGDSLHDIIADIQSQPFFEKAGHFQSYREALDAVAPLKGEDGKMRPVESLTERFQTYADDFVQSRYGQARQPIHKQSFEVGDKSVDALHRALSATPEGVAAFKPVGDLSPRDRNGLRKWWETNVAKQDAGADDLKAQLADHEKNEPEKESTDMFGETSVNPEWSDWQQKGGHLKSQISDKSLDWSRYVSIMGSPEAAISAVQDLVRSRVIKDFADNHNRLNADSPLKLGRTPIRGAVHHLDAVDPAAREARLEKQRALVDSLRERSGGKYASGSVVDKIGEQKEKQAAFEQSQMGFFSTDEMSDKIETPMGADERHSIGHAAEQKLAGMMSVVGQNFKPGQPTKLWAASMSGKYAAQQRTVKLMEANKRIVMGMGAGSGKTGMALGATAHLIKTGKIKRALHLVPSIVQDQYGGEALRYLEPGQFKWHCQPGASREERIAAYKDLSNHFTVMTHESFRSDMLHMGAQHAGITPEEMNERVAAMNPAERKEWARGVMDKEGIDFGATFVDEAHQIVNRAGKENSARANVIDAVTDNTPYMAYMSGDPVKNDVSEAHDVLAKMDRARYGDRAAFMRMYGGDTVAAKAAFKRELARYGISQTIAPDVKADYQDVDVPLSDSQHAALKELDGHAAKMRLARMGGKVDVEAAKSISPDAFSGAPEDQHEAIAKGIQDSLGIVKESAIKRIINAHPDGNAKVEKTLELAEKHKGQPGVVFAHNRVAVEQIIKALEAKGHRVASITGADSATDKAKKKALFQPESGDPQADIMVMSDAGAVGMNLQRASWLAQHDVPDTAMLHGQRSARIHRLGQKNNVSVYTLYGDHKSERRAKERLQKKYKLRELMLDPMDGLDDTGVAGFINKRLAEKNQDSLF